MIVLPYGSSDQSAAAPEHWNIVPLAPSGHDKVSGSEGDVVIRALSNPIGSRPFEQRLTGSERVTIIVSDKTRKCRTDIVLPAVCDRLSGAGIAKDRITILFANGTHPPQSEDEIAKILGPDIARKYRIEENHAKEDEHVHAGTTSGGTPIELHRTAMQADFVISIGTIVHHYFAGYGGGAKLFMPGVASYRSAVANHRRTLTEDGKFHPECRDGKLDGNPVADDIWDAVRFFPPNFYIGTILDGRGRVKYCVAGDLEAAHRHGCGIVDEMYGAKIEKKADCVLVSPGGYPKDINLIQTHKSLHHATYAVKEGGVIICLAECRDGIGNPAFMQWFDYESDEEMRSAVLREYAMNAHTAIALNDKARRFQITFVSSLDSTVVKKTGMLPAATLEEALSVAADILPAEACVYTIANGFLLVPMLAGGGE